VPFRHLLIGGILAWLVIGPVAGQSQTPIPAPKTTNAKGGSPASALAPGAKPAGAPLERPAKAPAAPRVAGPIAPVVGATTGASSVTGTVGTYAVDRINVAAATSAALVPSAPRWVPVTIVNRSGGRVPNLALSDLGIIENGVRQRATAIERWPLWLVIVLDVGRQIGPAKQLAVHRQLVYDLLFALGEDDHVALVQYSDGIDLIQPWTQDAHVAETAVEEKFQSGLDGQLWDSVAFSVTDLLAGKLGHRMVVVVTDGVDDAGRDSTYGRASQLLRDSGVTLHIVNLSRYLAEGIRKEAFGMNGVLNVIQSPSYLGRRKELRQYAEQLGEAPTKMVEATRDSGGKLFMVAPEEDPTRLPQLVWQQIEGQMMVSYVPDRPGDVRSPSPVRSISAFVTRGDIEVAVPAKLFVPIVSPRSVQPGATLKKD
jgi:hypothetical protein